jgi:hypothetical protein
MDDEDTRREADARVRAALTPDDAVPRRVVLRALGDNHARPAGARRLPYAVVGAVVLALLLGMSAWQWRRATPARVSPSFAVVGRGAMVVVESQDGRRWVVGPPPERRTGGNYVIVVRK